MKLKDLLIKFKNPFLVECKNDKLVFSLYKEQKYKSDLEDTIGE
ncbi:hypothetical protein [Rickettsia oklahomensis]|uniref:Uncharacterized protein n=1 Tax=Rickettsia oklahomensis TaxID=3141789 RepID=A0AAU7BYB2_9RICK